MVSLLMLAYIYVPAAPAPEVLNLSSLLSTGLAVVSIATLAGMGLLRGTVTNLRELLNDARGEIKQLKDEKVERETEMATMSADLAALKRTVTGEVHWVALDQQLTDHHKEAVENWKETRGLLVDIRDELKRERP